MEELHSRLLHKILRHALEHTVHSVHSLTKFLDFLSLLFRPLTPDISSSGTAFNLYFTSHARTYPLTILSFFEDISVLNDELPGVISATSMGMLISTLCIHKNTHWLISFLCLGFRHLLI